MKKLLLCASIAIFGFVATSHAQISFGAKAGVNFASIGGDETDDLDGKTGFHVGVMAEIPITEMFAFQPELLYSAQGAKFEDSESIGDLTVTTESKTNLNYLNVPLMFKVKVDGFAFELGPQIGLLLSAKNETEISGGELAGSEEDDIKDSVSGTDLGANFGVSYRLESGLSIGARYNLGLSNINDFEGSDDFKNQNNVIQVSVGYFFN